MSLYCSAWVLLEVHLAVLAGEAPEEAPAAHEADMVKVPADYMVDTDIVVVAVEEAAMVEAEAAKVDFD